MRYLIAVLFAAIAIFTLIVVSGRKEKADGIREEKAESVIEFTETEYDFGIIKQSGGTVSREFPFVYRGDIERKVVGIPTSCGCTTAKVDVSVLKPGQRGVLTVTFDPNLHAEPEGRFFKTAEILTEPAIEPAAVKIWAEIDLDLGSDAFTSGAHDEGHDDEHLGGRAYHTITPRELRDQLREKDFFLLDVHVPEQTHIPSTDAVIAFNALRENAGELPEDKDAKIVLYCRSGGMSRQAAEILTDMGYTNVWDLEGGINAYNAL